MKKSLTELHTETFTAEREWTVDGIPVLSACVCVPQPVPAMDRVSRLNLAVLSAAVPLLSPLLRGVAPAPGGRGVPCGAGGQHAFAPVSGDSELSGHLQ